MKKDFRISESMETLQNQGPATITTEDLLAIIIGSREKAGKLLHQDETLFSGQKDGLSIIAGEDYDGLKYRAGLSQVEATRIMAAIEIGKRIAYASAMECQHITSPGDAAQYFMKILRHETHEKFYVMLLNTKNRIIRVKQISEGSLTSSVVHPRSVFSAAITSNSAAILVAHNHPSGNPYPSTEDRNLTRALEEGCNLLGIPLLDHVVIGDGKWYSFKEHGDI